MMIIICKNMHSSRACDVNPGVEHIRRGCDGGEKGPVNVIKWERRIEKMSLRVEEECKWRLN